MISALHQFKAEFFKALGHPVRLAILDALRQGEQSVSRLAEELGLEQPSVSQQLAVLRQRGLVIARKEGTTVHYRIADPQVYVFLDLGRAIFERHLKSQSNQLSALQEGLSRS
ncbi:ArsR/SmtB family transcription factor [Meiothermus rufus]|uniref:ArsR/SmtB family transcription factor n=1 Tax=Meiothermus rufus TaxID=604332 RepID=UPI0003FF12B9|nr:metalloregulator ArsR/SmtB family transcription factor [Meiothermus rufus]